MKTKKKTTKKELVRLKNPKWELFCRYYAISTSTFGNATLSYANAFGYDLENLSREAEYEEYEDNGHMRTKKVDDSPYDKSHKVCSVEGCRLLAKPSINDRINKLLYNSLTDELIDTERTYVIKQRENLAAKNSAMRDFDKVRGRIIDKFEINNIPIDPAVEKKSDDALTKYLNGHTKTSTKK